MSLTPAALAAHIDHTLLRPDATAADIRKLCEEAAQHRFHSVCIHGSRLTLAGHFLEDLKSSDVKLAAVVGFPLGACDSETKRFEAESAIDLGAQEIDVVVNIGRLKDGDTRYVLRELRDIVEAADGVPVKVILETSLLTESEKQAGCSLVVESGARFVKTSTGFNGGGATLDDVRNFRAWVGPKFGVKASGGIRDTATALAMIAAGASRLGTSAGVAIVCGLDAAPQSGY